MGKRRNTAKTGDSKIYKGRVSSRDQEPSSNGGDLEIDEIETNDSVAGDQGIEFPSHTLDLGDGSDDSSTSDRSSEHDDDQSLGESPSVSSDDDSTSDEAEDEVDLREWGKTKSALYGGDTADIELTEDKTVRRTALEHE